ncbi:tetratricopeptide repeat protein 1 [Coniochaeta ligniaria NRRL 30616]|uniref:Tetratricopeptide repeat protein 1 n=1 Tax=Coniochaeta ligniaria NRRL 30616 TaxID=1408157 RepID=A0A1J7JTY2_9PEZI|nr:tetratricopeptide repeat protein 1 [Coniochaeta ligniaria NRRL 30616]
MASAVASAQVNGGDHGANGASNGLPKSKRFSNIPDTLDVPVNDGEEAVEIDLRELADDPTELCTLFEMENAPRPLWMNVALAYAKLRKPDIAIEMLTRASQVMQGANANARDKLTVVTTLCWMYLWKCREAPRVAPDGVLVSEAKTKEFYLQLTTSTLNEALRLNPTFPPLFLARGVLYLLRASLQTPSKASGSGPGAVDAERAELLRSALKSFDDAIRVSQGRNMLAVMGKSRALFSLGKYAEALAGYQDVLSKMPDLVDPDPRIGIGCCFWQLGFKDDAKGAWERCLEINPDSKIANILLGLYYLGASGRVPTNSADFIRLYKKAMTEYTQKSFKLDKDLPLTCATFANYFLSRKNLANVDALAHKAIQYTDVNAIASDGWYLLARKEHYAGDVERAADYYRRSDDARGGTDRGYLPAKFGAAQLTVLKNDLGEAKLRLEKMIQQSRHYEAMILLGTLYAEEVFANQYSAVKEDKSAEAKKAISLLEGVRNVWKDPSKNLSPDSAVLLNLARLYENDSPDKALQCLQQVEQLELDQVPESQHPEGLEDTAAIRAALRKHLPPQLLNNIGCFYSQAEKHELASEMFEAALSACMRISEKEEDQDTDALVTTISFNLGRSYESRGLSDQAVDVYEGLLKRHDDYTDARLRLAYIKLRKNPNKEGPDAVAKLYQEHPTDVEVRALYGWFLGKVHSKKKPSNPSEDPELRHYKHTLQNYDKHDRYALVGMGNIWLTAAREMRRESESDKKKRSDTYSRAVEFFDKALQLDPKNAYAAQGVAIALVEDKKDYKSALPIFLMVRDTIRDAHVYVNLGHIYAELKQFSKAIEFYEMALSKEGKQNDAGILSCLGRTWLNKGRQDRDLEAYKMALECAEKALSVAPEQVHFKFNVAFVQIQLAMTIHSLPETSRTTEQLQQAAAGLEAAISALDAIAASPHTPYPKHDIEQRANMARNTQRKQLERAVASQKEYEERNKEKIAAAREQREAELRRKEEERQKVLAKEAERREKIRREREEILARDRALAEQRAEEEEARMKAEMTTDSETGEKVKRKRKAAAKSGGGEKRERKGGRRRRKNSVNTASGDESEAEAPRPKKKQRLASRKESSKYKSAEIVEDSSSEGGGDDALERAERALEGKSSPLSEVGDDVLPDDDKMEVDEDAQGGADEEEEGDAGAAARRGGGRRRGRIVEESDEDEEAGGEEKAADDGDEASPAAEADASMADAAEDDEE